MTFATLNPHSHAERCDHSTDKANLSCTSPQCGRLTPGMSRALRPLIIRSSLFARRLHPLVRRPLPADSDRAGQRVATRRTSLAGEHYFFALRGSSAGLTYVKIHGPVPWSCTMVLPFTQAKWRIPAGQKPYVPAGILRVADWSNFSPMPRFKVPERTVTRSTFGCQCG